jgi:hypothetical protein
MWALIFFTKFVWNILILRTSEWDIIKTVYRSACKVPLFLSDFNETWIFSADSPPPSHLPKKTVKRHQVGAESFQADTHDASNSHLSQFYKCTKLLNEFWLNLLMIVCTHFPLYSTPKKHIQ